ncbi:MAG: ParA family protein [Chlamydiota bacterium]
MITFITSSFKGGTGKTSVNLHLGCGLGLFFEKRCLFVDSDPQANLSSSLGFSPDELNALPLVLQGEKTIQEVVQNSPIKGVDIVLANTYLDQIESTAPLVSDPYSHERLRDALKPVAGDYDFCFVDIPPSFNWLCRSAFYAADYSIIAAEPEPFSVLAMERLAKYHRTVNKHHKLEVLGVVLSLWDERGAINSAIVEGIEQFFPGKIFNSKIRRDKSVPRAVFDGKPIFLTEKDSRAAKDYKKLIEEFLKRVPAEKIQEVQHV